MPKDAQDVSMEELFAMTSSELAEAAAKEGLVYSGNYLTKVRKLYPKRNNDDAEYDPGRTVVSMAVTYYWQDEPSEEAGQGFIKTSPELRYTASGRVDGAGARYIELAKALGADPQSPSQVYKAAESQMFMTRVQESYQVVEDALHPSHADARIGTDGMAWVVLQRDDDEERKHYIELGNEPRTLVKKLYKAS